MQMRNRGEDMEFTMQSMAHENRYPGNGQRNVVKKEKIKNEEKSRYNSKNKEQKR